MPRVITKYCIVMAFLFVLFAVFAPALIAADDNSDNSNRMVLTQAEERLKRRITYSCRNLPIDTVLIQLAEQAQIDIIKSPSVTGDVTVKVTNIPLEEVLNNILAAHGYTYVPTEHMIRVVSLDEVAIAREKLVTRIYRITYADVSEVASALGKFISKQGEIATSKGTSNLIVTDIESKINAIDNFVEEIDRITPQVLVEVRIYDVTSTEGFELGIDWEAGRNTDVTTIERESGHTRSDTLTGPTDTWVLTETITDTVDTVDPTNTGTVTETELQSTQEPETTGYASEDTETVSETSTSRRSKPFITGSFDKIAGGTLRLGLLNDAVDIDIVLNILHTQLKAQLLANPRILVLDNETANFKIVREIPYQELTQTGQGSDITSTEFKEVGVELEVTPHIARDGMLRLHIRPRFGIEVGESVTDVPIIDTREADTTLLIQDGQTVVLGGLRKKEITQDIFKVPILADVPLVGGLFKSESESVTTNELVVFITPRIIEESVLSETEIQQLSLTQSEGSS